MAVSYTHLDVYKRQGIDGVTAKIEHFAVNRLRGGGVA